MNHLRRIFAAVATLRHRAGPGHRARRLRTSPAAGRLLHQRRRGRRDPRHRGRTPGWQITLIAVGAALLAAVLAVLLDRAWAARKTHPATA